MRDVRPRHFQADLDRLYRRVIVPALVELPADAPLRTIFPVGTLDGFLERAEHETNGLLAKEVRRGFVLMIAAVFERQLVACTPSGGSKSPTFNKRLQRVATHYNINLEDRDLGKTIGHLHLIANVARHGDGRSLAQLRDTRRDLWPPEPLALGLVPESMVINDDQFRLVMLALTRFWGRADHEPLAVIDAPY